MASDPEERDAMVSVLRSIVKRLESIVASQSKIELELSYLRSLIGTRIQPDVFFSTASLVDAASVYAKDDFPGLNWYPSESRPGTEVMVRWSGPGRLSSIFLPLSRDRRLTCRVEVGSFAPGVSSVLSIFDNGRALQQRFEVSASAFDFDLPAIPLYKPITELSFLTESTRRPCDVFEKETDQRWLGFELCKLEVFPAALGLENEA